MAMKSVRILALFGMKSSFKVSFWDLQTKLRFSNAFEDRERKLIYNVDEVVFIVEK